MIKSSDFLPFSHINASNEKLKIKMNGEYILIQFVNLIPCDALKAACLLM